MSVLEEALFGGPDRFDVVVDRLWQVPGWPRDRQRDREFVARLAREFPTANLPEMVTEWSTWLLDHPEVASGGSKTKVNWRSRFRTWCKNGVAYGRERRERQGSRAGGRRVGGTGTANPRGSSRPGSVREFGDTRRLDDW